MPYLRSRGYGSLGATPSARPAWLGPCTNPAGCITVDHVPTAEENAAFQAQRAGAARVVMHSGGVSTVVRDSTPAGIAAAQSAAQDAGVAMPGGGGFLGGYGMWLLAAGAVAAALFLTGKKKG